MERSKFQTIVEIPQFASRTSYSKKNMFLGSCFTENVGKKMKDLKYQTDINPFGILYNPMSVANGLNILLQKRFFEENDLAEHKGIWHSFSHHGNFSSIDKTETLEKINRRIQFSAKFLKTTDFLFITFGTAWIFKLKSNNRLVSNCHKIPSTHFLREKLSIEQIADEYIALISGLQKVNPKIKVVFTISPIRHWKDGAIENQRSKATLLLAVEQIIKHFGEEICSYFPSYEIVMDELRDYRFYADDMLHLTEFSVQHIWEKFALSLIEAESQQISKQVSKILNAVNHRPINKDANEFQLFVKKNQKKIQDLETKYPNLNFKLEKEYFNDQLSELKQND